MAAMVPRPSPLGHALLLALALSGCLSSPDRPPDDESRNRRQWESQRIADYHVQSRLVCFCVREATEPVTLEVRNRALVSVTRVADGRAVDPSTWAGRYYTVDQMFALIAASRSQGAHEVRVSYDPLLGYPSEVFLDRNTGVADDERHFALSGLTRIR